MYSIKKKKKKKKERGGKNVNCGAESYAMLPSFTIVSLLIPKREMYEGNFILFVNSKKLIRKI